MVYKLFTWVVTYILRKPFHGLQIIYMLDNFHFILNECVYMSCKTPITTIKPFSYLEWSIVISKHVMQFKSDPSGYIHIQLHCLGWFLQEMIVKTSLDSVLQGIWWHIIFYSLESYWVTK